jgi:hypothetical protein
MLPNKAVSIWFKDDLPPTVKLLKGSFKMAKYEIGRL